MNHRLKLILRHWLDSLCLVAVAGTAVALVVLVFGRCFDAAAAFWASLGVRWVVGVVFLAMLALACVVRRWFLSVAGAIWPPWKVLVHCGIVVKAVLGTAVCCIILEVLGTSVARRDSVLVSFGLVAIAFATGTLVARALAISRSTGSTPKEYRDTLASTHEMSGEDLLLWLRDDKPVRNLRQNRIAAHEDTARRILQRLLQSGGGLQHPAPNVALVGPYGSGKTTVCELAKDLYANHRPCSRREPRLLFCRFEAWPYLTPEAAVRGLLRAASQRLMGEVDDCGSWRVPDEYVRSIAQAVGRWSGLLERLLGSGLSPEESLAQLGDALVRLNSRLVIVVDDLDRIEARLRTSGHAVLHALNQMQEVPHVQFVLCLSPMSDSALAEEVDFVKLTQYQESVPLFESDWIMEHLKQFEQAVLGRNAHETVVPARERGQAPQIVRAYMRYVGQPHWSDHLLSLLATPRDFKNALRHALALWEGGLAGEINWDDLIWGCALRSAEPEVWSLLLRSRVTLEQEEPTPGTGATRNQGLEQELPVLRQMIEEGIQPRPSCRKQAVQGALRRLFPHVFSAAVSGGVQGSGQVDPSAQRLCFKPRVGRSYFERFTSGVMSQSDVADQATLRFTRDVEASLSDELRQRFEKEYLPDCDERKPRFFKLVQFAPLLSAESVWAFADMMFETVAHPGAYGHDMIVRLRHLVDACPNCGGAAGWLNAKARQYGKAVPLLVADLLGTFEYGADDESWTILAEKVRQSLLDDEVPAMSLLNYLLPFDVRINLGRLLWVLARHGEYDSFRSELTQSLVAQAEGEETDTLKCRIVTSVPAEWVGEFPEEATPMKSRLDFNFQADKLEAQYDVSVLLPAFKRWQHEGLSDPVSEMALRKVLEHFRRAEEEHAEGA